MVKTNELMDKASKLFDEAEELFDEARQKEKDAEKCEDEWETRQSHLEDIKRLKEIAVTECTWREQEIIQEYMDGRILSEADMGRIKVLARGYLHIVL